MKDKQVIDMDQAMMAKCGTYCGTCSWKEPCNCSGCKACQGQLFWGTCDKAICCIERGYEHCGFCPDMPCQKLMDLFNDPEHGDNGARLRNLKNWANGIDTFEKTR